jgi:hypothetical protein
MGPLLTLSFRVDRPTNRAETARGKDDVNAALRQARVDAFNPARLVTDGF